MEADEPHAPDAIEDTVARLIEAIAVLETIEFGGMLGELPADPMARDTHQRAVSLLAVLRRDLVVLRKELQAAGQAQDAIARARSRTAVEARRRAQP
jgi:hypothetical protein